jgi:voltage-gated potassium channel
MANKLFPYRFELFFFIQIALLFGSLIIPIDIFETIVKPLLFLSLLVIGIVFISERKILFYVFIILVLFLAIISIMDYFKMGDSGTIRLIEMDILFPFFIIVTYEIINQILEVKVVTKNVILGLLSGYISIGFLGMFLFINIEFIYPGSFVGIDTPELGISKSENLMYFSYITALTIGYGDIAPVSMLAKKATILMGLIGQFYLVIVMAIVVAKYMRNLEIIKNNSNP